MLLARGIHGHPGRWRQLLHALQDGARRWHHGMEVQVVVERDRIDACVDVAGFQQGRQTGGKSQALVSERQIQRLDTQAIPGDEQPTAVSLPDGEGEHAVELGQHILAPGVISLEQDFGVTTGIKAITLGFQLGTQFRIVVDGAVEHHGQTQFRLDHGLARSFRQIHDLQPAMAQGDRPLAVEAPGIGSALFEAVGNALHHADGCGLLIETKLSGDAAHDAVPLESLGCGAVSSIPNPACASNACGLLAILEKPMQGRCACGRRGADRSSVWRSRSERTHRPTAGLREGGVPSVRASGYEPRARRMVPCEWPWLPPPSQVGLPDQPQYVIMYL